MGALLHCLADAERLQKMANSFGIGKSTASKIIRSAWLLLQNLFPRYYLPKQYITISQTIIQN